jgi:cytochrome c oxidase subunit II
VCARSSRRTGGNLVLDVDLDLGVDAAGRVRYELARLGRLVFVQGQVKVPMCTKSSLMVEFSHTKQRDAGWVPLVKDRELVERGEIVKNLTTGCFLLFMVVAVASHYGRAQSTAAAQTTKEVQMTAKKYEFSPSTVEVPAGTKIIFKIKALDREHGFEIENVKNSCVKIKKGETATVEYLAEKPGTVEFRCCSYCGFGHGKMKGKIVIQ